MKALVVLRCLFRLCLNEGTTQEPKAGELLRCPLCGSLHVEVLEK